MPNQPAGQLTVLRRTTVKYNEFFDLYIRCIVGWVDELRKHIFEFAKKFVLWGVGASASGGISRMHELPPHLVPASFGCTRA